MGAGDTHAQSQLLAEQIARTSYGRLLAILSVRMRDVAAAEDALASAFEQALKNWPEKGIPENPEGWLVRVARNRILDGLRHAAVKDNAEADIALLLEEAGDSEASPLFADDRLKLLFVCAHPAIDPAMHTPLMLQTVLGLDAARIGSAFLVAPSTMGQRLVRAKTKIRAAGIPFEIPDREHLPARMDAVLDAIYAAYGTGWDNSPVTVEGGDTGMAGLAEEALYLGTILVQLMPDDPEAKGLLALMLYTAAREQARRGAEGKYIPLDRQKTALWDRRMISRAERLLVDAAQVNVYGRYQIEAAIQSAHIKGRLTGRINWPAILLLYRSLIQLAPSLGARVSLASALAMSGDPQAALAELDSIRSDCLRYQPFWAALAHTLAELGRPDEAVHAYDMAIGLSEDSAVKAYLAEKRRACITR